MLELERPSNEAITYGGGFEEDVLLRGVTRVLIGGFDNAGKSTLACSLYEALNLEGVPAALYELDRWSDTHDAILERKPWSLRQKNFNVTKELYQDHVDQFMFDDSPIVIGDLEGRQQSPYIPLLDQGADFAVLVTRAPIAKDKETDFLQTESGWRQLFGQLDVPVATHVRSVRAGQSVPADALPISGLERKLVPHNRGVRLLAHTIIHHAATLQDCRCL